MDNIHADKLTNYHAYLRHTKASFLNSINVKTPDVEFIELAESVQEI